MTKEVRSTNDFSENINTFSPEKRALLALLLQNKGGKFNSFPLSFAQQRMWFIDQVEPGKSSYNVPLARRLKGKLDTLALARSLTEITRRHESLRTTFTAPDGRPLQTVSAPRPLPLPLTDLSHLPTAEREPEARRLAAEEAQRPFDLTAGPLFRARLLRLEEDDHVLLLTLHHIVSDGRSLGILLGELSALYGAYTRGEESPLEELPVQYADYAVWQREWLQGEVLERQLGYWRRQLLGAPPVLELPTDRPRPPVQGRSGAHKLITIPIELTQQIKTLSRRENVTLFMTLLAAFQVLLARYAGQADIVVGTNMAGRDRAELEGVIGFFINTLVMRTDLSGNPTLREALGRVREVCLEANAHQDVPFEKLVETLKPRRNSSYSPLFQAKFDLLKNTKLAIRFPGIKSSLFWHEVESSRYDIFLVLSESGEELRGSWTYNPELFDPATIERMLRDFVEVLEGFVKHPGSRVDASAGQTPGEARKAVEKKPAPNNFKKFTPTQPKAIKVSREHLVRTDALVEGQTMPLIVRPAVEGLDLRAWARSNGDFIGGQLRKHGAILFRDFPVESVAQFEQFVKAASGDPVEYQDQSSPRSRVGGNIYSSTDHPADQSIFLHNENSYSYSWPLKLFFFCVTPPGSGGETPIADSRRITARIAPRIRERFREKRVMYVRNFGNGFGLPWQTVFQTDDSGELDSYCRRVGIEVEWRGADRLQTRQVRPALAKHPLTGDEIWFNHAVFFHISTLEPSTRESLLGWLAEDELPYNTYYGDGSPIEAGVLDELREAYRQETVVFPWERRDVLMLDNMLAAHGRRPYGGARQIVVGMAEPFTAD
jgi:alpha-ketoglutarate-dependent taurine dioxygenase